MTLQANKSKLEMNLAPYEWGSLYKQLYPVINNGANSIRHLEGCVLIILEAIEDRKAKKRPLDIRTGTPISKKIAKEKYGVITSGVNSLYRYYLLEDGRVIDNNGDVRYQPQ